MAVLVSNRVRARERERVTLLNFIIVILVLVLAPYMSISIQLYSNAVPLHPSHPLHHLSAYEGSSLREYVRYWEPVDYGTTLNDHILLHRVRRNTENDSYLPLRLNFNAHNKKFRLLLYPDFHSIFADDIEFITSKGAFNYDKRNVYSGSLEDDENSIVHGVVTSDGLFDGNIITPHEIFYIEPLHRYNVNHPRIHSIIYKVSDVVHPKLNNTAHCASQALHLSKLNSIKDEAQKLNNLINNSKSKRKRRWLPDTETYRTVDISFDEPTPLRNPSLPIDLFVPYNNDNDDLESIIVRRNRTERTRGVLINTYDGSFENDYSNPNSKNHVETKNKVNNLDGDEIDKEPVGFTYVSSLLANVSDIALRHVNKRATIDPKKTTCMLYLQADHQFFQKFGTEEACIEVMTRHVQRVNAIYKVTDFNQDGKADNITFMIKRIKVHTTEALKDPLYRFPNNYGVEKFLELFSEEDYDGFCLAYMFTYRDFEMGTLGLAWTGDLKNAGGVCEKNGHYRGSLKSLNTGIVTLLNYGKHVPPAVSHVTLAHEIGHNFGSPHDPEVCTPGGEDGNFIMFARATSGDKKNNNHFSPCSLKSINPVLNNKARSLKGCFTEPQLSLCGNGVVEDGEECDCGWEGDCREPCCHPQRRHPPPGETPCTLTPRSVCSPSQGPCCTGQCTLKFGEQCRTDNGCRDSSFCDGRNPLCPQSTSKPNRTVCDDGFVCYMGECTGSICLAYGLESCQCDPDRACDLCCKLPGAGNPCKSSFIWNTPPYDVPDLFAKPGTPCNDYNGYCDVFQKCREVDPSGPLATLRNLLLSEESLNSFKKWMYDYWYAAILIVFGVIGLLVASTHLLGKKSDGKLKTVTIIHSSTTETVRLPEHCLEGVIVHTAVRSKLPLKKKVALKSRSHRKTNDKDKDHNSPTKSKKKNQNTNNTTESNENKSSAQEAVVIKPQKNGRKKTITIAKRKKTEIIDYSATQKDRDKKTSNVLPGQCNMVTESDSRGKVHNWLLNSHQPTAMSKSKSTPVGLAEKGIANQVKSKVKSKYKTNSKSVNNLSQGDKDKMRLQVIYRPPFKFSLKLCKSDKTRVVLDKTAHNRDIGKKKHIRHTDEHNKNGADASPLTPLSNNINPFNNTTNTLSHSSTMGTLGLSSPNTNLSYDKNQSALPREEISANGKISQWTHKKSNSLDQNNIRESRQNLLMQEQLLGESNAHFYENLMFSNSTETPSHLKSSSMPRNISPKIKNRPVSRHNSQNTKALSRTSSSNKHNDRRSHSNSISKTRNINSNLSSPSNSLHIKKVGSLNNLNTPSKASNQFKRYSITAENAYSNINFDWSKRQSTDDLPRKSLKTSGSNDNIVDRNKKRLKRQMSATELFRSSHNIPEPFVPMSAGANASDAYQPEFNWSLHQKSEVPKALASNLNCSDSQRVPKAFDKSKLDSNTADSNPKCSSNSKVLPLGTTSVHNTDKNLEPGPSCPWPVKFSELKDSLPDSGHNVNPVTYQSDMEVLVSDNDYSLYDA